MDENLAGLGHHAGTQGQAWVTVGLCPGSLTDEAPAFVLLQLCPIMKASFEDMYADLLHLVRGKCTAPFHPFPLLLGPGSAQGMPYQSGLSSNLDQEQVGGASVDLCLG